MINENTLMNPGGSAGTPGNAGNTGKAENTALFASVITNFTGSFAASAINLAIPAISEKFQSNPELTGWILTGFLLANVAFLIPCGRIADKTGKKRIFAAGIFLFTLTSAICAFSGSTGFLILFRILQGIGGAMVFSTNMAVLVDAFPPQRRGKALGISVAATYIGLSVGPPAGGILNNYLGWRSIFWVIALLGVVSFFVVLIKLPGDSRKTKGESFDIPGNILYLAAISLVTCGISFWASHIWALAFIPAGVILGIFFVRRELRCESPVLNIRLLTGNRNYAFSNLAALFNYCFTMGIGYYISIYLQLVKGYGSLIAGAIMIGQPLFQAVISPYAGKLSDRVSPFKVASAGMGICAAGLLSFCFISADTHLAFIITALVVIGTGFGFFSSPNTNAIMSCVGRQDFASANSFLATMRNIGQTTSLSIVTSIMTARIGRTPLANALPGDIIFSMRTGFILFTLLCVTGIFLSMQRNTN